MLSKNMDFDTTLITRTEIVISGCCGTGKSTFLSQIMQVIKVNSYPVVFVDNTNYSFKEKIAERVRLYFMPFPALPSVLPFLLQSPPSSA